MIDAKYRAYVASAGVFLGACIISLAQRLLSVGLPDLRGALGLSFDEAAWIPTACDMGLMFMGGFTVYLAALLGRRRVLLVSALIFMLASSAIPLVSSYWAIIALQILVGLSAGTFYPMSLSYALSALPPKHVVYGIAGFTIELLATLCIGTPLQAWFVEHWSYRWMFWAGPLLTIPMLLLIHVAMTDPPKPSGPKPQVSFAGFVYACLAAALFFGALQQGERLDWLQSGTIVGMLLGGGVLLVAATYSRVFHPNPLVNLRFLGARNTLLLAYALFSTRFVLLSILFLVPGYLGVIQGYRALETGRVLGWSVAPFLIAGLLAAELMKRFDGRLVATLGLLFVGGGNALNARLTSAWTDTNFLVSQLLLAVGLACTLLAVIGMVAQQLLATGAIGPSGVVRPFDVLTYASFFQVVRLFGGQLGTTIVQRFVDVRELFHSNRLSEQLQPGDFFTEERLRALTAGLLSASPGIDDARGRALVLLGGQVRRQAYVLAYADAFTLTAWVCAACMLAVALIKPLAFPKAAAVVTHPSEALRVGS